MFIWSHGAGRVRHGGDRSSVFVRKTILISNFVIQYMILLNFNVLWLLSCPIFFSKLRELSRLVLVPSFFLEQSVEQVSVCGTDARDVLADWLITIKPRELFENIALLNYSRTKTAFVFVFAFALCIHGPYMS